MPSAPACQQSPVQVTDEQQHPREPEDGGPRLLMAQRPPLDLGACQMCLANPARMIIGGVPVCESCPERYEIERPSAGPADS